MFGVGLKIVDKDLNSIVPLVERALMELCPLEVGLYFADQESRDYLRSILPGSGIGVAVHLDHRRLSLLGLSAREDALRDQLRVAEQFGAELAVTHLGNYPMTHRPARRPELWDRLAADLACAERIAEEYGIRIHIENTFHPLPFYRDFCSALGERRTRPVDLCFDLGHAKVWSAESLNDWICYIETQTRAGARLHVHLHANRGLADEHLSFSAAIRMGISGADDFSQGLDWFQMLATLEQRFPNASKVFEVPPAEAITDFELAMARLGGHPS